MRDKAWRAGLIGCERGNSALMSAAVLPLLISSAAIAYDTVQLAVWMEQVQHAADAGAIAAAEALTAGRPAAPAVDRAVAGDPQVRVTRPVLVEIEGARVHVRISARREFRFLGAITARPAERTAEATALMGVRAPQAPHLR